MNIDYNQPISSHFSADKYIMICLFPFYHRVFSNDYDWKRNLKLTYPLVSTITWNDISSNIGFDSLNRLAQSILELKEPFKTELSEYCEWKKIEMPNFAADKIPEVILIPILQHLKLNKSGLIETKTLDRFPDSESIKINLEQVDLFDLYDRIQNSKYIITESGLEILLPDYDCPYVIIAGTEKKCNDLIISCNLEHFEVNLNTKFDWWNQ